MEKTRPEIAKELFSSGYNCCQSVVLAYADVFELDKSTAEKISAGFGGGMGRMREVCGAFSGAVALAGMLEDFEIGNNTQKKNTYALVQDMAEEFKNVNGGSIICRDLLGLSQKKDDPNPSKRTAEYYKKRPCGEIVKATAEIVEKYIISQKK